MDSGIVIPSSQEALDLLRHPSVVRSMGVYADSIKDDYSCILVDQVALIVYRPIGKKVEAHVACRYRDRAKARSSMMKGLKHLFSLGYELVFAEDVDERASLTNMLKSLQFIKEQNRWVCYANASRSTGVSRNRWGSSKKFSR